MKSSDGSDINQKSRSSIKLTLQGKFAGADSFHQVRGAAKIIEKTRNDILS